MFVRERGGNVKSVCLCVREREKYKECVFVLEREGEIKILCVCVRDREK